MSKLSLSFISGVNERVAPLFDGRVNVEGVELICTRSDASETFWRQLNFEEFDISEMSLSSYLIAKSRGVDMIAIPIFPVRRFMHMELFYHVDSGINSPRDLVGKRIGVGEYQQTAALWMRGILEHDFGVSQYKVHWYMERSEALSHGGATGFKPPEGISFHRVPPNKSLASMLVNHELDAAPVSRAFSRDSNIIDRSTQIRAQSGDWSKVKRLFPIASRREHAFSKSAAISRQAIPTLFAAMFIASIPGWPSISIRRLSPQRSWPRVAWPRASRQPWCLDRNISKRPGRYLVTILIPTAFARTHRCSKRSSTTRMSRA